MKFIDLSGKRFGRLKALYRSKDAIQGNRPRSAWMCQCDCGVTKIIVGDHLKSGLIKSCGCLRKETLRNIAFKHGLANHPLHSIWRGMRQRCGLISGANENMLRHYSHVSICKEWAYFFEPFFNWAIKAGWRKELGIDRINTLGDYTPANCRFVTQKVNSQNRKDSKIWIIDGIKFESCADAAEYFGKSVQYIHTLCRGKKRKNKIIPKHPNCSTENKYDGYIS